MFQLKKEAGKTFIFDIIRMKWITFTPEEKVRQYCIKFLIELLEVPHKFISVEKTVLYNNLKKRYDIVVYDKNLKPALLVECKSETIDLKPEVCMQIATYNLKLQVRYLWISNGSNNYFFHVTENTIQRIENLPEYEKM